LLRGGKREREGDDRSMQGYWGSSNGKILLLLTEYLFERSTDKIEHEEKEQSTVHAHSEG